MGNISTRDIAQAAGISPRTRYFVLRDEYGFAYDGSCTSHVLAALQRADKTPDLPQHVRVAAIGLYKCYSTGRMNAGLYCRITSYSPYRLCGLLAKIANGAGENATIGQVADEWINKHATEL